MPVRNGKGARRLAAAAVGVVELAWMADARAQAIQRNLPPAAAPAQAEIAAPNLTPGDESPAPIGPALRGIILLGPESPLRAGDVSGVDTTAVARLNTPAQRARLQAFIGRPLSRKLIAEVEAEIAQAYRDAGFPFVSVLTPAQEITSGLLQVRVVEFQTGRVQVKGMTTEPAGFIEGRVRTTPGQPIDARKLTEDLDWLNRYPFRSVQALFSPGDQLGRTDLTLAASETKPWQVFAGYSNTGSASTTWDRYFVGATIGNVMVQDATLSYQFTSSSNFWDNEGQFPGQTSDPRYVTHAVRWTIPTAPRQQLEANFDFIQTNTPVQGVFLVRETTYEGALGYRQALSDFTRLWGDIDYGVEVKHESRDTAFEGAELNQLSRTQEIYQLYFGYSNRWSDPFGRSSIDVTAHVSPFSLGADNTGMILSNFSDGHVVSPLYGYVNLIYDRYTRLPRDFGLSTEFVGQAASNALPLTEQLLIGGQAIVRGYSPDDGSYDHGFFLRNEVRTPVVPVLARIARVQDLLAPYAFLDAGYGSQARIRGDVTAVSTGVGANYRLGPHFNADADVAVPITDAPYTRAGDVRVEARVQVSF